LEETPVTITHFDTLSEYGAETVRVIPATGDPEEQRGAGGGLEEAFERIGQEPLVGILRDPSVRAVLLCDGELMVEARRAPEGSFLMVSWAGEPVLETPVVVPSGAPRSHGPVFRPQPDTEITDVASALCDPRRPLYAVSDGEATRWYQAGRHGPGIGATPLLGTIPAVAPASLGSTAFQQAHGVRWAYIAGAMAGGIASVELVIAMARAGLLGFFGAGGLPLTQVEEALKRLSSEVGDAGSWGFNLLHNPNEPQV